LIFDFVEKKREATLSEIQVSTPTIIDKATPRRTRDVASFLIIVAFRLILWKIESREKQIAVLICHLFHFQWINFSHKNKGFF